MKNFSLKQRVQTIILLVIVVLGSANLNAQVTIGSENGPIAGAILQLKETEVNDNSPNSSKGIELPRVELTDKNQLFPMFQSDGAGGYITGSTPYVKATEDAKHTGLLVYHTGTTQISEGIYCWDGQEWLPTQGAWYVQGTSDPATSNTQHIYHQGNVTVGTPASKAELAVNGNLTVTDVPLLANSSVLVVDNNGNVGTAVAIPAKVMLLQSATYQDYQTNSPTTAKLNSGGQDNAIVVEWKQADMQTNNIMTPDYANSTFRINDAGFYEVSGFIIYDPNTNITLNALTDVANPEKFLVGLNLAIQIQKGGAGAWTNIAASRLLWTGAAVAGNSSTVSVPPILERFDAGDKIRMVFYRPSKSFGLEHGKHGTWGITFVNGIDFIKGIKVVAY
jgi:hypothetical protein